MEEYLAELLERQDKWERARWAKPGTRVSLPAPVQVERPEAARAQRNIVTDPAELRRWFAKNS